MVKGVHTLVRSHFRGGNWHMQGFDTGRLEVIRANAETLILKEHGHHYYGGLGQRQPYAPATFSAYRIVSGSVEDGRLRVEYLIEWLARPVPGAADPYKP